MGIFRLQFHSALLLQNVTDPAVELRKAVAAKQYSLAHTARLKRDSIHMVRVWLPAYVLG